MAKKPKKVPDSIDLNAIKYRKQWGMNPSQRPHGSRGYERSETRLIEREAREKHL